MNGLAIGINPEASDVGQGVAASRPYCRLLLAWAAAMLSIPNGEAATGRISRYAAPAVGAQSTAVSAVNRHRMLTQEDKSARTGKSNAWHRPGSDRCICHASIPA